MRTGRDKKQDGTISVPSLYVDFSMTRRDGMISVSTFQARNCISDSIIFLCWSKLLIKPLLQIRDLSLTTFIKNEKIVFPFFMTTV